MPSYLYSSLLILALVCESVPGAQVSSRSIDSSSNSRIPRTLTSAEREASSGLDEIGVRIVTPAPTGPIRSVAEYEPTDAMVLSWKGDSSWQDILSQMTLAITTVGNADVYVAVNNAAEQALATTNLVTHGVNMDPGSTRVRFISRPAPDVTTDTIWINDYGPRYAYEGNCRVAIDHAYDVPTRVNDDAFSSFLASYKHHAFYEYPLIHAGGNAEISAQFRNFATRLVVAENPSFSESDIFNIWMWYQNVNTHFFDPYPQSVDLGQHLDMWMQLVSNSTVIISDWPNNPGSPQDVICDNAAAYMASQGYTVFRTAAFSVFVPEIGGNVHYTYTNAVICNNLILVPSYANQNVGGQNGAAATTYISAKPGATVVQVPCESIIPFGGALHSIALHLPKNQGGVNPNIYMKTYRGGQTLPSTGNPVDIQWISDDDKATTTVDIRMSTDAGQTYDYVIVNGTPDDGHYTWFAVNYCNLGVRFKVIVHDEDGNTGSDASTTNLFMTSTAYPPGDCNCNCHRDINDLPALLTALLDPLHFSDFYPGCPITASDFNADGVVNGIDIKLWVDAIIP